MTNDQAGLSTTPLLLKFAERQRADGLDYRYDPAQSLNVATADGPAVVASAQGKSRLKTLKEFRGAED